MRRVQAGVITVVLRDAAPEKFLWGGRVYLVQEVLTSWLRAGGWWRSPRVRELFHGTGEGTSVPTAPPAEQDGRGPSLLDLDDSEQEFWRVVAGCGRASGTGVFELCFTPADGVWRLARIVD